MQESSFFQYFDATRGKEHYERGIHEGREQGSRKANIRYLLTVLEFRFDGCAVHALRPAIESIQEWRRYEDLYREALHAETFEDFARSLGAALDAKD